MELGTRDWETEGARKPVVKHHKGHLKLEWGKCSPGCLAEVSLQLVIILQFTLDASVQISFTQTSLCPGGLPSSSFCFLLD